MKEPAPINVIIINSHPIQYFAPLYQYIAKDSFIKLNVYYCSNYGLNAELDKLFGVNVKWDLSLLDGYSYKILKNNSTNPSIYSFWGLLNLEIIYQLWKAPKSVIWIHGWAHATNWLAIFFSKVFGHTVCLRGESPLCHEWSKSKLSRLRRKLIFKSVLFPLVDRFFYIGKQNKAFYEYFGVKDQKLIWMPYAVNNDFFREQYLINYPKRDEIRRRLGINLNDRVILYSGKYTNKKRPIDLLKAYHLIKPSNVSLIFMGEGDMRKELESYIKENQLQNVYLTGFINQSEIANFYSIANVYVMCSGVGETWGLSTNEAMNFKLPIVLSDQVGCAEDLLEEGHNGFLYQAGDVVQLSLILEKLLSKNTEEISEMGDKSSKKVGIYSYGTILSVIKDTFLK
ncbi:glycosyltransferase family 4 protein [Tellurirhabdus bombi]|uniref:glycosyltransferase family 4 protein n=1 Tax=Tellurirhabdus bombi TaxID=2907205 RepID=UPI001F33E1A5|nr:glycosyltransferase family 4 protein [Tellurirhabdus bombi]